MYKMISTILEVYDGPEEFFNDNKLSDLPTKEEGDIFSRGIRIMVSNSNSKLKNASESNGNGKRSHRVEEEESESDRESARVKKRKLRDLELLELCLK